jgi:hypothetical protein
MDAKPLALRAVLFFIINKHRALLAMLMKFHPFRVPFLPYQPGKL